MTFIPPSSLGPFTFPSPYWTRGIRLTNASNAPRGVPPRVYPYYSIVNNHAGQGHLWVIAGRVGLPPALLRVDKASGAVSVERELPTTSEAEGWFFSDRDPSVFFYLEGPTLHRFHVDEGRNDIVFTLDSRYGDDLWQLHNSADDQVHSATVRRRTSDGPYDVLGCVAVRNGQQSFFSKRGIFDECIVDKSGRWLIGQEKVDGDPLNWIIDLHGAGVFHSTTIRNAEGALGHLDVGDGFMVGEDDSGDRWQMTRWDLATLKRTVLVIGPAEWGSGMGHLAVRGGTVLLSSNTTGELYVMPADGSGPDGLVPGPHIIAPGLIDGRDYDHQLRACLDPTGEYAVWVAELDGRLDLLLVQLPNVDAPPIVIQPPDQPPPPPTPGGSMTRLTIFAVPEDATVHFRTDSGSEHEGVLGTADGRPAFTMDIDAEIVSRGHGAELTIDWQGTVLKQHGFLRPSPSGQAEFIGDVFYKPASFR